MIRSGCLTVFIWMCLALFACGGEERGGSIYYISSEGDDSHSGKSPQKAWKTIDRINIHSFSPGEKIRFRGGDEFEGTIALTSEDAGTSFSGLHLSSFGEGQAVIHGKDKEGLRADSCGYLTIENLVFTGLGRKTGNTADGLLLMNSDGIVIRNVEVIGFQHSGIHIYQCNNASITRVYAHENGFAGIHVSGNTIWDTAQYANQGIYIGYCVAENNPGDPTVLDNHSGNGILASSVRGGVIEYCEAFNNGWDMPWTGNGPVGIWIWDCTDFIIQHCISHHNRTNPEAADGGGFDLDGGVSNSIIQYCISHNNEGAGFGLYEFGAAKKWKNNIVRHNISQDDGIINGGSLGIWKNGEEVYMGNCQIYNNTFYNSLDDGSSIWIHDNMDGFQFLNNVFVFHGPFLSGGKTIRNEIFQGNIYWNLEGDQSFAGQGNQLGGLIEDPLFNDPGMLTLTDPEKIDSEHLIAYGLKSSSTLIDHGLDLKGHFGLDHGPHDLVRTLIPQGETLDIGAIEYIDSRNQ